MRYKHEELAAARVRITNKDYQRTVLRGIPEELAKFASPLLSAARPTMPTTLCRRHGHPLRPHLRGGRVSEGPPRAESAGHGGSENSPTRPDDDVVNDLDLKMTLLPPLLHTKSNLRWSRSRPFRKDSTMYHRFYSSVPSLPCRPAPTFVIATKPDRNCS
jgi:hypothetical protein